FTSLVKIELDRPYSTLLFVSIASSNDLTGIKETTGPKISSCEIRISIVASVNTVGSKNRPPSYSLPDSSLPPANSFAPSSLPFWIYCLILSIPSCVIIGPTLVSSLTPSPIFSSFIFSSTSFSSSSFTSSCTITRLQAVQRCPLVPNELQTIPSAARSRSASSMTTTAFFPPISRETFFN